MPLCTIKTNLLASRIPNGFNVKFAQYVASLLKKDIEVRLTRDAEEVEEGLFAALCEALLHCRHSAGLSSLSEEETDRVPSGFGYIVYRDHATATEVDPTSGTLRTGTQVSVHLY
ncbi:hypothetical protein HPB51_007342 [Rhipicephalus microplus]|uniref:Uncharacterized protein n=1 Tax=Rhipicephalus microplus TaxID=6941 RepID=A0A9J6EZR4_RHIMP|nr:hypothetical protein HPB51_007342 [Rhipicephalus microplus]